MNIKKFNLTTTPCKADQITEIIPDTTTIEIGTLGDTLKKTKKKKNGFLIVFFIVCCAFSVIMYAAPLPKAFEDIILKFAQGMCVPLQEETLAEDSSSLPQETKSEKLFLPAASDSDIFPESNDTPVDLSFANLSIISNETSYNVNIKELLEKNLGSNESAASDSVSVFAQAQGPQVLIIHTHGTEGYAECADNEYRSHDKGKNVVAQGKLLAQALDRYGIQTIHCETMFDENSYIKAYSESRSAVGEYLSQYPSIKYVIDVHRDAVPDGDGKGYSRLSTVIDEESCAQLMLVVGTNEAGADHPRWEENLITAVNIQKAVCESYPTLMRSINLRRASFNQQLCTGYFILEAGNCANSSSEASRSIELFAKCFAEYIKEK